MDYITEVVLYDNDRHKNQVAGYLQHKRIYQKPSVRSNYTGIEYSYNVSDSMTPMHVYKGVFSSQNKNQCLETTIQVKNLGFVNNHLISWVLIISESTFEIICKSC